MAVRIYIIFKYGKRFRFAPSFNKKQKPFKFCRKIRNVIKPFNISDPSTFLPWDPSLLTNGDCVYPNFCVSFAGPLHPGGPVPPPVPTALRSSEPKTQIEKQIDQSSPCWSWCFCRLQNWKIERQILCEDGFSRLQGYRNR